MSAMNEALNALIRQQKQESANNPDAMKDEVALGILIARHFKWDGDAILRVAVAALEDANFHTEAERVDEMRETLLLRRPGRRFSDDVAVLFQVIEVAGDDFLSCHPHPRSLQRVRIGLNPLLDARLPDDPDLKPRIVKRDVGDVSLRGHGL
jgi:hypothetical protein